MTSGWKGWLMSYSLSGTTLTPQNVWMTTPVAAMIKGGGTTTVNEGSVWMGGNGAATDDSGNIFVATGNGPNTITPNTGGPPAKTYTLPCVPTSGSACDFSNSIVELNSSLTPIDYFSTADQWDRSAVGADIDLGSGGVLVIPTQPAGGNPTTLLLQGGKGGDMFLVNRGTPPVMGGYDPTSLDSDWVVQFVDPDTVDGLCTSSGGNCGFWTSSAWWNAGHSTTGSTPYNSYVFVGPENGNILQATLSPGTMSPVDPASLAFAVPAVKTADIFDYPGVTPIITAGAEVLTTTVATLWALANANWVSSGDATLFVYDAGTLGTAKWNSVTAVQQPGIAVKFTIPTVVNGKVYVGNAGTGRLTVMNQLTVYGCASGGC
jgi:hypothetical protein